jgi:hypothetical protein
MLTSAGAQSFGSDRLDKPGSSTMVEQVWRRGRRKLQVHLQRVTLIRPDSAPVIAQRKASLVVFGDDPFEQREG